MLLIHAANQQILNKIIGKIRRAGETGFPQKKLDQKKLKRYSGYTNGLKEIPYREIMAKTPELALFHAVKGMLPKNALGRQMIKKLRCYRGAEHPHEAQKPEVLVLDI